MIQSGGFLGRLLGPLLKTGLPLLSNVIKTLAKSVLIPLGLTAALSAADAGIHKKYYEQEIILRPLIKSFYLKCRKDTENINPRVSKTSNNRTMVLSKCAICGSKKSRFIKNQEAKGILSNLGIKTLLSKVPILGDILF